MNILVKSIPTFYEDRGEGPVLIFLHGWGADSGSFTTLAENLAKDYRVITIDLPGFGRTKEPEASWELDDYVHFIAEFLNKLEMQEPYTLIGHSMGGRISIKGAGTQLLRPKNLVLLGSHGIVETSMADSVRSLLAKIGKFILPKRAHNKVINKVGSEDYAQTVGVMRQTFKNIVGEDLRVNAKNISVPTMLIYGENDTDTPPRFGQMFNETIADSRLFVLEGSGHYVQVDAEAEVEKLIREFINE